MLLRFGRQSFKQGGSDQASERLQQGDQLADALGVEGAGVELVPELDKSASSLLSSSASRAFSFFSCSIAFLSCKILCSNAYRRTFKSTVGRQLSVCNSRRQGGSDARNSCLLR